jgi:hypothetical protein
MGRDAAFRLTEQFTVNNTIAANIVRRRINVILVFV